MEVTTGPRWGLLLGDVPGAAAGKAQAGTCPGGTSCPPSQGCEKAFDEALGEMLLSNKGSSHNLSMGMRSKYVPAQRGGVCVRLASEKR